MAKGPLGVPYYLAPPWGHSQELKGRLHWSRAAQMHLNGHPLVVILNGHQLLVITNQQWDIV